MPITIRKPATTKPTKAAAEVTKPTKAASKAAKSADATPVKPTKTVAKTSDGAAQELVINLVPVAPESLSEVFVPLDSIKLHPKLSYRAIDAEHVEELQSSIALSGLDARLHVFNTVKDETARISGSEKTFKVAFLSAGRHRLAAIKALAKADPDTFNARFPQGIPVVFHEAATLQQAEITMIRENVQHLAASPESLLPILNRLVNTHKMQLGEIAAQLSKSIGWVSQHVAILTELPKAVLERVLKGEIRLGDARKLANEVRVARNKGDEVDAAEVTARAEKLAEEKKALAEQGSQRRAKRKVRPEVVYTAYKALKLTDAEEKCKVLAACLSYLAGEREELPKQIQKIMESDSE